MAVFLPRIFQNEIAQAARLMDEAVFFQAPRSTAFATKFRSFQPRFDVRENKDNYELSGELPGCTDVNVEFTDESTLLIKGKSEHSREEGTRPSTLTAPTEQPKITDTTEQTKTSAADSDWTDVSSQYQKASVEDESAPAVATPATTVASEATATANEVAPESEPKAERNQSRYWVSERSFGKFSRTFTFTRPINQEAVKASLKDGILSVVVPKAIPATRRINIE